MCCSAIKTALNKYSYCPDSKQSWGHTELALLPQTRCGLPSRNCWFLGYYFNEVLPWQALKPLEWEQQNDYQSNRDVLLACASALRARSTEQWAGSVLPMALLCFTYEILFLLESLPVFKQLKEKQNKTNKNKKRRGDEYDSRLDQYVNNSGFSFQPHSSQMREEIQPR